MGIDLASVRFLSLMGKSGVDFAGTLMLGRQNLYARSFQLAHALRDTGRVISDEAATDLLATGYAEPFFRFLGAETVQSMDASAYEHAEVVHDLNQPIPSELHGNFSVVFDGGTLEHVFNFPVAIANAMRLVKPGGHLLSVTTANNYCGHGFYQFSPELFFRVLSPENGFETELLLLHEMSPRLDRMEAWQVVDPAKLGRRVDVVNATSTLMMVRARKVAEVEPFERTPMQSDYSARWMAEETPIHKKTRSGFRERSRAWRHALRGPIFALSDFLDARTAGIGAGDGLLQVRLDASLLRELSTKAGVRGDPQS